MYRRLFFALILCIILPFCSHAEHTQPGADLFLGSWEINYSGVCIHLEFYPDSLCLSIQNMSASREQKIPCTYTDNGQIILHLPEASFTLVPIVSSANEIQIDGITAVRIDSYDPVFLYASNGDGTVEITGFRDAADPLVVPAQIDGMPVTGIANAAFAGLNTTGIVLPDSLLYIGNEAFAQSDLHSLYLPDGILSIGADIVRDCASLTSIRLPKSLLWKNIAPQDFSGCPLLATVDLPADTPLYEAWAAEYPHMQLQAYVDYVGVWRGGNHEGEDVTLTLNENGSADMVISVPGKYMFQYAYTWVTDENGVVLHGARTVRLEYRNAGLWGIDYSLAKDVSTEEPELPELPYQSEIIFAHTLLDDGTAAITGISEFPEILVIPSQINGRPVTVIEARAFSERAGRDAAVVLREVIVPEGVHTIETYAFEGCTLLEKVTLPDSLTDISYSAFSGCTSLREINLPENLIAIRSGAFSDCSALSQIVLPASLQELGPSVFSGCSALRTVILPQEINTLPEALFLDCTSLEYVAIPSSVKVIQKACFKGCTALAEISLPDGLSTLEEESFKDCTALCGIVLPDGLNAVEAEAFSGCDRIMQVFLPDALANVGKDAFPKSTHIIFHENKIVQLWAMIYGYRFTKQ